MSINQHEINTIPDFVLEIKNATAVQIKAELVDAKKHMALLEEQLESKAQDRVELISGNASRMAETATQCYYAHHLLDMSRAFRTMQQQKDAAIGALEAQMLELNNKLGKRAWP